MTTQTLTKMHEMKLHGMAASFQSRRIMPDHQDLNHDEFTALLVDDEYIHRQNNRQRRLLQRAKLKFSSAALENIDYQSNRGLLKSRITALQNNQWLEKHQNVLISGPTGVGKSYLACAFGQWACRYGFTVYYSRWPRMLGDILAARGEGYYLKYIQKLTKVDLLIIDDFGLTLCQTRIKKTSWKSSRIGTWPDQRSSPASCQSRTGMLSSAIRLSPMRSATACFTSPTSLN
jgi:DNA replication protein DnaC